MPINFRVSALVPVGLIVESVAQLDHAILVTVRADIQVAICSMCGSPSRRVHSRYVREVSDLPCSGRSVRLRVVTRRFCCDTPHCRRRIFAERFDKTVLLVRSRRTSRLDCVIHHLGLALGGRPAASFAKRLMLRIARLMTSARDHKSKADTVTIAGYRGQCADAPRRTDTHRSLSHHGSKKGRGRSRPLDCRRKPKLDRLLRLRHHQRYRRRPCCLGPAVVEPARPKARSPSSSWSSGRCTAEQR